MGALPRPDLAPGPQRELNDALHALHHRAGWPSLRNLASDAGCSHTTVSHVFSSPKPAPLGSHRAARRGHGRRHDGVPRPLARGQ